MTKKINFLNIAIDSISMQETLLKVESAITSKTQIHHTVEGKLEKDISQRIKVSNFITFTKENE